MKSPDEASATLNKKTVRSGEASGVPPPPPPGDYKSKQPYSTDGFRTQVLVALGKSVVGGGARDTFHTNISVCGN